MKKSDDYQDYVISFKKVRGINKMRKYLKPTFTIALAMTMIVGTMQGNNVYAKEVAINNNNLVDELEKTDIVEYDDEKIIYDDEAIYDFIEKIDMSNFNAEAKKNGLDIMTREDVFNNFVKGIEETNETLEEGKLTMLSDGTMIDSDDDAFYLQGGSTKDVTKWWGKKRYKSTSAANKWVKTLNRVAAAEGGIGVIAGAALGVVPGIVGGIGCWYCWDLASSVSYVNGQTNRGIIANIPWILVGYSVEKQ